jgi:hypothetical protein
VMPRRPLLAANPEIAPGSPIQNWK